MNQNDGEVIVKQLLNNQQWLNPKTSKEFNFKNIIHLEYFYGVRQYQENLYVSDNIFSIYTKVEILDFFDNYSGLFFIIYDEKNNYFFNYYDNSKKRVINRFSINPKFINSYLTINVFFYGKQIYENSFKLFKQTYGKNNFNYDAGFSIRGWWRV